MVTKDIGKLLIKIIIDMISVENIHWQVLAGRLIIIDLYKQAARNRHISIENIYSGENYKALFDAYIEEGKYYRDFYKYYSPEDILKAGEHLSKTQDFEYAYTTSLMLAKRYLLNPNKIVKELPQEMYMSVALFLAIPEPAERRLEMALAMYDACSSQKISLPTPTLLNARTNFHQLSSCFKINIDDDLRAIYHSVENMAQISKF
jgi:ribonucleoside-diphosphate reductase alpha chain